MVYKTQWTGRTRLLHNDESLHIFCSENKTRTLLRTPFLPRMSHQLAERKAHPLSLMSFFLFHGFSWASSARVFVPERVYHFCAHLCLSRLNFLSFLVITRLSWGPKDVSPLLVDCLLSFKISWRSSCMSCFHKQKYSHWNINCFIYTYTSCWGTSIIKDDQWNKMSKTKKTPVGY